MTKIEKKIVGYSDVISLRPLEKISFMISSDRKIKSIYSRIVKLILGILIQKDQVLKKKNYLIIK